tara:strand:+ start:756 stop:1112 length:357 start_codon:yes stop_codon:yes gene_type:complete
VRGRGLEPPRVLPHRILNPARLPVPPPAQTQSRNQNKDKVVAAKSSATTAVILLRFLSANVWPIFPDEPGPPSISDNPPPLPLLSKTRAIKAIEIMMWTVISIAVIVSIDKRLAFLTI